MCFADMQIVVLSYGDGPVKECIRHLLKTGANPSDILVIHNPSVAGETVNGLPDGVSIKYMESNVGYAAGMNAGIRESIRNKYPITALITHDVCVSFDTLKVLEKSLQDNPSLGITAPRLSDTSGNTISGGGSIDRFGNVHHLSEDTTTSVREVDWVDGAVVVTRHTAPLIPEQYFLYYEDVAWGVLTRSKGLRVACNQSVSASTNPGAASRRLLFAYYYWRNRLLFARNHLRGSAILYNYARAFSGFTRAWWTSLFKKGFAAAYRSAAVYLTAIAHSIFQRTGRAPVSIERIAGKG